jgi:hypothetical protein
MRLPGGNWSNLWLWDHVRPENLDDSYYATTTSAPNKGWTLTTDKFYDLADSIGATVQPCVNYSISRYFIGSDSVERAASYAANWVKDTKERGIKAPYWEVGNENYGSWQSGWIVKGDTISGADYGRDFTLFADSMKKVDPNIKIGAVIYPDSSNDKAGWYGWTKGVMSEAKDKMDYLILHEYFTYNEDMNLVTPEEVIGSISKIAKDKEVIEAMVERYTQKPAGTYPIMVSEFNLRAGYKEMSILSPIFQTMAVNEFIKNGFGLLNLWGMTNAYSPPSDEKGDHGMLTRKDPNRPDYEPNPAFYGYYFMSKFTGDAMVSTSTADESVKWYSSKYSDGNIAIIGVNSTDSPKAYSVNIDNFNSRSFSWYILDGDSITDSRVRINGEVGSYDIGGPLLYDTISPYKSSVSNGFVITVPSNGILYGVVEGENSTEIKSKLTPKSLSLDISSINNRYYLKSPSYGSLEVISLSGRIVESYSRFKEGILGANLTSGAYIIKWRSNGITLQSKFIIR